MIISSKCNVLLITVYSHIHMHTLYIVTFNFYLALLSISSLFYNLYLLLSFLSFLIILWACDSVGVCGLRRLRPLLTLLLPIVIRGVLVGKSPTLLQFRVSQSGSNMQDYTSLVKKKEEEKKKHHIRS